MARIGIPAAATTRVMSASSPRRIRTAIRPITAPPGTVISGSRTYIAFVKALASGAAVTTSTPSASSAATSPACCASARATSGGSRRVQYQPPSGSTSAPRSASQASARIRSSAGPGGRTSTLRSRPTSSAAPHGRPQTASTSSWNGGSAAVAIRVWCSSAVIRARRLRQTSSTSRTLAVR